MRGSLLHRRTMTLTHAARLTERASRHQMRLAPVAWAIGIVAFLPGGIAYGTTVTTETSRLVPCARVLQTQGDVRLLDEERVRTEVAVPGASVPCGGWITVREGWAKVSHRDGHEVIFGRGTHAQAGASLEDGNPATDHWILLSGELYVTPHASKHPARILSANSRAQVRSGAALVIYSGGLEATQLVALSGESALENRFLSHKPIAVRPGEATQLDFAETRTVPATPRAVRKLDLRRKLVSFHLETPVTAAYLKTAEARAARTVPKDLLALMGMDVASRRPASLGMTADQERQVNQEYERHELGDSDRARLERLTAARLTGGHADLLQLTEDAAPKAEARVAVQRAPAGLEVAGEKPASKRQVASSKSSARRAQNIQEMRSAESVEAEREANEKRRVMEALARLRPEVEE